MRKKNRYLMIVWLLSILLALSVFAAELKNERARQEGNRLVISYDLEGKEKEAEVNLTITVDGKTYKSSELHIEGDVDKQKTGQGKKITWNILRDFPRGLRGEAQWELTTTGDTFRDSLTGMEFIFVKGGCYQMGDTFGDGDSDEKPVHEGCVSDFYMGKYEVTQGQWRQVMRKNPASKTNCGDNCPVEEVTWNDVQEFIEKLNRNSGKRYHLPTEAQWEYAARSAGKKEKWSGTSNESELGNYAWYSVNAGNRTHPVGQKQPNGLGLYDMNGNVWEWCSDWYGEKYYGETPRDNPGGPSSGSYRVMRGGAWGYDQRFLRASSRFRSDPDDHTSSKGFRVALSEGPSERPRVRFQQSTKLCKQLRPDRFTRRPHYQIQKLSMTENTFLFLIEQKKQFLEK
jgi:formylglycine-generating enzyme